MSTTRVDRAPGRAEHSGEVDRGRLDHPRPGVELRVLEDRVHDRPHVVVTAHIEALDALRVAAGGVVGMKQPQSLPTKKDG
jgi:hypothetical protein